MLQLDKARRADSCVLIIPHILNMAFLFLSVSQLLVILLPHLLRTVLLSKHQMRQKFAGTSGPRACERKCRYQISDIQYQISEIKFVRSLVYIINKLLARRRNNVFHKHQTHVLFFKDSGQQIQNTQDEKHGFRIRKNIPDIFRPPTISNNTQHQLPTSSVRGRIWWYQVFPRNPHRPKPTNRSPRTSNKPTNTTAIQPTNKTTTNQPTNIKELQNQKSRTEAQFGPAGCAEHLNPAAAARPNAVWDS